MQLGCSMPIKLGTGIVITQLLLFMFTLKTLVAAAVFSRATGVTTQTTANIGKERSQNPIILKSYLFKLLTRALD